MCSGPRATVAASERRHMRGRLRGDAEDQVEVHVLETRLAQDLVRPPRLLRAVDAAEHGEELRLPRLHAHAHAVDPERRRSTAFSSETVAGFISRVHSVSSLRSSRARRPVRRYSSCGVESALGVPPPKKIVRGRNGGRTAALLVEFEQDGVEETAGFVAVGRFLVEAAIRTNLRAERDVHVEVPHRGIVDGVGPGGGSFP